MALIKMNYLSSVLYRTVNVNVILPTDRIDYATGEYCMEIGQRFPTLYLLHGMLGSENDWVSGTRIQRWAEERNLAVVMPAGENAYYEDYGPGRDYGRFIGKELVDMTRRMFPLSDHREDTFIAGLSMGGFGAILNGIRYSETFSHIAAFSPATHVFESEVWDPMFEMLFGNRTEAEKTERNPRVAWERLREEGRPEPKFYISCGTEDELLPYARVYRDFLREEGAEVTYREEPGAGHEWDFWDREVLKAIEWFLAR